MKTNLIKRFLASLPIALALLLSSPAMSFTIDIPKSAITGLWWNPSESGWGVTITQQTSVMFITLFTYDASGNPSWYVASNCAVSGAGCVGDLYKVTGGAVPTATWNANVAATKVGTMTLAFTDNDTGSMSYSINGANGFKQIVRQMFGPAIQPGYVVLAGATWMPVTAAKTQADAISYCATTAINGKANWRTPTQTELDFLYNSKAYIGQGWTLDTTWSSNTVVGSGANSYNLSNGLQNYYNGSVSNYVACVNSPTSITPTGAYVVQAGLTWMPISVARSQADAITICTTTLINGLPNWRLPTVSELLSLFNSGAMNGQGWTLGTTWSSNTVNGNGSNTVNIGNGLHNYYHPAVINYVACVHS
jgi:hypothetical protein